MKIDLLAISENRIKRLHHRLEYKLSRKEKKATIRMLNKECEFYKYLKRRK